MLPGFDILEVISLFLQEFLCGLHLQLIAQCGPLAIYAYNLFHDALLSNACVLATSINT